MSDDEAGVVNVASRDGVEAARRMLFASSLHVHCSSEMAGGVRRKSPGASSPMWGKLHTLWQDKHLVLFKTEYTLLVVSVLWFLEIGINLWVIQKVACK